jgi:CheY-like chemotaxis protein
MSGGGAPQRKAVGRRAVLPPATTPERERRPIISPRTARVIAITTDLVGNGTVSDEALADFRADVTLSFRNAEGPVTTRVVMGEDQFVLATEETSEAIALRDVFDIAQDVPAATSPDTTATVTLGFERGESRETATIECRAGTLAKFQLVVFKLVLNGTRVTVSQTGNGGELGDKAENATLEVCSKRVCVDCDDRTLSFAREDIDGFETSHRSEEAGSMQPTLALFSERDGRPVQTLVRLPSFRHLNLFGRYLQSSPDAGRESSPARAPAGLEVLVVDDDPGDLETIELLLTRLDDRRSVTTATSAPGGMEALEAGSFDCVVSDYDMPGTDGVQFLERVRERSPDLPFILFTGQGSESVAKQAILSDVTDYVEKGIGSEQYEILATRIRKAVR